MRTPVTGSVRRMVQRGGCGVPKRSPVTGWVRRISEQHPRRPLLHIDRTEHHVQRTSALPRQRFRATVRAYAIKAASAAALRGVRRPQPMSNAYHVSGCCGSSPRPPASNQTHRFGPAAEPPEGSAAVADSPVRPRSRPLPPTAARASERDAPPTGMRPRMGVAPERDASERDSRGIAVRAGPRSPRGPTPSRQRHATT